MPYQEKEFKHTFA